MTDQHHQHTMTPYRATPQQWAALEEQSAPEYDRPILELRARVEALESAQQPVPAPEKPPLGCKPRWLMDEERLHDLEAATKRYEEDGHSVPSEWRAEIREIVVRQKQRTESAPTTTEARLGGLVERVADVFLTKTFTADDPVGARAAIREVAKWVRGGTGIIANGSQWADILQQEADRG